MTYYYPFSILDPLGPTYITVFRKFILKLSDDLNQAFLTEKMKEYLTSKGYGNLPCFGSDEVCSLDIVQAITQARLISSQDLSSLKEMVISCSRNDLVERIDDFINNPGIFKKGWCTGRTDFIGLLA